MTWHLIGDHQSIRVHCTLSDELVASLRLRSVGALPLMIRRAILWSLEQGNGAIDVRQIRAVRAHSRQCSVVRMTGRLFELLERENPVELTRSEFIEAHCWRYLNEGRL